MTLKIQGLALLCGAIALSACAAEEATPSLPASAGSSNEADAGGESESRGGTSNSVGGSTSSSGGTDTDGSGTGGTSIGGNSSDAGNSAQGGEGGADRRSSSSSASYYVPVPAELAPWATYPVGGVGVRRDGDNIQIRYGFPRWLSGNSTRIVLVGVAPEGALSFDVIVEGLGTGTCTQDGVRFDCTELLPGVEVDREKARGEMEAAGLTEEEIEKRLQVTDSFAVDPIGIVTFELSEEDEEEEEN